MLTRNFSVGKRSPLKRAFFLFVVSCFVIGVLSFSACKMDDATDYSIEGLDDNLVGTWKFDSTGYGGEEIVITNSQTGAAYEYYSVADGSGEKTLVYKGDIRYAKQFDNDTGVIVIEYQEGYKQVWNSFQESPAGSGNWVAAPIDPQPAGNFYGIYYHNLGQVAERNNRWEVFLVSTSDQGNNYGPTEAETLNEAIERFTEENITNYIDLTVGNPQYKD